MDHPPRAPTTAISPARWRRTRWISLSPTHQDHLAALVPLAAVFMFLAAIVAAFWYLRAEEGEREQEALRRDVEYSQHRVHLRLLESQEQITRMARDFSNQDLERTDFVFHVEGLINQYPELQAIAWIDERRRIRASRAAPTQSGGPLHAIGETLDSGDAAHAFDTARARQQPVYIQPLAANDRNPVPRLQLHVPLIFQGKFAGAMWAEYSVDSLLRYSMSTEILAHYAVTLLDARHHLLAGMPLSTYSHGSVWLPWAAKSYEYKMPVSPVGDGLVLRAQAYRTSLGMVDRSLFWLVGALSAMTTWMLIANWRHTRRRLYTQEALIAETNFRRAMENSMAIGMRALDMNGRMTYVNAAFCQMTGWCARELIGQSPPFTYWPEPDREALHAKLHDGLSGEQDLQIRVQRKDGTLFDARLYVSPLIDAHGQQAGWMTSIMDITASNRVREQLSASRERFTVVLESLDASVSVAPLGSEELLFANKRYREWFGSQTSGHLQLVAQACMLPESYFSGDGEDALTEDQSTDTLTDARSKNAEIYCPDLGRWIEVRSRYLNWVDGRLAQMVIATDITPRRQAEEQAAHQANRAQATSRLITMGEIASSVAHELNQPLTAISNYCSGMVSRIKRRQIAEDVLLSTLEKTAHQAQRAGQIIQRIRAFVKKSEPNRALANVPAMVNEAVELVDIELRRHNVRLTHYVAAQLPPVMADTILIEQVLINLMKNSAESIQQADRPASHRSVELRVVPHQLNGQDGIEFTVQDTGKGLATEMRQTLFEAFFSTKQEGMGIGLNLCRSIVESHQGRMRAENVYNGTEVTGCCFSFWLPQARAADDATGSVVEASTPRTLA